MRRGSRFVSLAIALVIFLLKLGSFYVIPPASEATNLLPYDRLAEELTQRGLGNAQFVTLSPRDAGNLAVALPEARALSLSARIEPPPPDPIPDRPCVLLWGGEYSVPPAPSPPANPSPARFLKLLGVAASAGDAEDIEVDWRTAADRRTAPVGVACAARGDYRGRLPEGRGQGRALASRASSVRARRRFGARCGKTWRQSAGVPLNTLRSTGLSMPDT